MANLLRAEVMLRAAVCAWPARPLNVSMMAWDLRSFANSVLAGIVVIKGLNLCHFSVLEGFHFGHEQRSGHYTHSCAQSKIFCFPPQNCCYAFMDCMKSWHPDWNFWARAFLYH